MGLKNRLVVLILLGVAMLPLSQSIIEPVYRIVLPPTQKVSTNIGRSHENEEPVHSTPIWETVKKTTTPREKETTSPRTVVPPAPKKTCEFNFKVAVDESGFKCRDLELITQVNYFIVLFLNSCLSLKKNTPRKVKIANTDLLNRKEGFFQETNIMTFSLHRMDLKIYNDYVES